MSDPACKGSRRIDDHAMVELGDCPHAVGGATYIYREFGCAECGATSRRVVVYACGTRKPRVQPTVGNCISLRWKAERKA